MDAKLTSARESIELRDCYLLMMFRGWPMRLLLVRALMVPAYRRFSAACLVPSSALLAADFAIVSVSLDTQI